MLKLGPVALVVGMSIALGCTSSVEPVGDPPTVSPEVSPQTYEGVEPGMKVHWQRGVTAIQPIERDKAPSNQAHHGGGGGGGTSNLIDNGGPVLSSSATYAIWWGTPSAFPSDSQQGLDALFNGLNGSALLSVADQYMRGSKASTSFHTNLSDSSSPPSRGPSTGTIAAEACKVIQANGLTPDPNAIYFVFTSNFPGGHVGYCAWHSYGTCTVGNTTTTIQVAYMPNTTGLAGCDPGDLYSCNGYSQGTRSIANVTSHEFMEAITDPDLSAWTDAAGSEIGDKCAWQFASCVSLGTHGNFQLQEEWSNSAKGCVQQ
jgi:hypothetical protein